MRLFFTCIFFLFFSVSSLAQTGLIYGTVVDSTGTLLEGVNVQIQEKAEGIATDREGRYRLTVPADSTFNLVFSYTGFKVIIDKVRLRSGQEMELNVRMSRQTAILTEVIIRDDKIREEVSVTEISPESIQALPSAFGDFNQVLVTLPGVSGNNELSSAYSVRGGNFDENLVYVNDIPVYRPFLVTNGQQEGLSFINPDMVQAVRFSAGGWQPRYGDKLSSVLNVSYKAPEEFRGSVSLSLLGGSAHVEGATAAGRVNYVAGVRHKSSQYLLNTLETEGGYRPRFTDIQSYVTIRLDKNPRVRATTLGVLFNYSRNRYSVVPETRTTEFGTFSQSLRFTVAFDGRELLEYDTWQGALKLTHWVTKNWKSDLIVSGVRAFEREYTDVEGGYRLCDVDNQPGSSSFNECIFTRGIGTQYDYGRNRLQADLLNVESRNSIVLENKADIEFGIGFGYQQLDDVLSEYTFTDSSGFVTDITAIDQSNTLTNGQISGYAQYGKDLSGQVSMTAGVRATWVEINGELLISPRIQVAWEPDWERDIVFRYAAGVYNQPAFFREFRNIQGEVNEEVKAQKSVHLIAGFDYNFLWWGREFTFTTEAWYKYLWDVIAYDVDNVKLRYYANNDTKAYAAGLDFRVNGEFIPGTESWFSLGILQTKEDAGFDNRGYIRRPTDQRVNAAIVFQDHLPNNPLVRVNLSVLFGSGLPFGPPNDPELRNSFAGESYRRVDIGFSRLFYLSQKNKEEQLLISAEVLNLLGSDNPISYLFIEDVNGMKFAVPNSLSARFLNLRATFRF
jgi:hypothetical protein